MTLIETLNQIWTQILDVTSIFVMPDWGFLIGFMPVLIVLGLIGPFLTGAGDRHGHLPGHQAAGQGRLRRGPAGRRDRCRRRAGLPGRAPPLPAPRPGLRIRDAVRCDIDDEPLSVVCPMCGLGRQALVDTCTNCGLVLKVKPRALAVRKTSGPKPGGAAAA